MPWQRSRLLWVVLAGLTFAAFGGPQIGALDANTAAAPRAGALRPNMPLLRPPGGDPVIAGAGDISCAKAADGSTTCRDQATSDLLVSMDPDLVFTTGDNQYESGALSAYNTYFTPTWGRLKARMKPVPGNHEYLTPGAAGYFSYFPGIPAYYSYDVGEWHVLALNSEISAGVGSPQYTLVGSDLASHPTTCALAYWHKPRFSSGQHGSQTVMSAIVQRLYNRDVDVVLAGHDHLYERFAPLRPSGAVDEAQGIRFFTVGMGGRSHYAWGTIKTGSQARDNSHYGVLKLTLHPTTYDWQFVSEPLGAVLDSGTDSCH